MSRRDRDDLLPPASERDTGAFVPGDVLPSDAESLDAVIDRRFRHLLATSMEPKDMTKALEAATAWWKVAHAADEAETWGEKLGRTTRND